MKIAIFSIATLLARNTTISPKLGDGDASNKAGLIFEEHDMKDNVEIECNFSSTLFSNSENQSNDEKKKML